MHRKKFQLKPMTSNPQSNVKEIKPNIHTVIILTNMHYHYNYMQK